MGNTGKGKPKGTMWGWIYLLEFPTPIKSHDHQPQSYFKIGCASILDRRVKQLAIQLPFPFELAGAFFCEDFRAVEREVHESLAEYHVKHEWFCSESAWFGYLFFEEGCKYAKPDMHYILEGEGKRWMTAKDWLAYLDVDYAAAQVWFTTEEGQRALANLTSDTSSIDPLQGNWT